MCLGHFFSLDQIRQITRKGGDLEGKRTNRKIYWDMSWNPQGSYDLYMGSKGFFTIILFNQDDRDQILEGGHIFSFQQASTRDPGKKDLTLSKKIGGYPIFGYSCTLFLTNTGTKKFYKISRICWEIF